MSGHWSTSTSAGAAIVFLGDQSPVPTQDRIRGDDARDLRQDPPAEFVTAHSESTTLGVRQAKRPRAQVFSEDPILLPEIVDQIVLVTVHPASEREDEELQRRRHSLRLLGRLDQHRPSLGRFFAPYGTQDKNLVGLMAVHRELLAQAGMPTRAGRIVLDMDSSESPVHGAQEGSAYNGHFESVCYHPLFLFTEHGGCVAATLRPGNVHSADDWDDLLVPEIERQQAAGTRVAFRADAAFAKPEIYEALEQRDVDYAIRMPANKSLELDIEDILFRPPGRPSRKPLVRYKSFRYQAKSWTTPSRLVAKVEHHRGELFPRVGFIVTNMTLPSRSVVRFYTKRGTAEQWIKEGK